MTWLPMWLLVLPSCPSAALLPPLSAFQGSLSVPPGRGDPALAHLWLTLSPSEAFMLDLQRVQCHW